MKAIGVATDSHSGILPKEAKELGISCHTGEGALGIGCSCRPKR